VGRSPREGLPHGTAVRGRRGQRVVDETRRGNCDDRQATKATIRGWAKRSGTGVALVVALIGYAWLARRVGAVRDLPPEGGHFSVWCVTWESLGWEDHCCGDADRGWLPPRRLVGLVGLSHGLIPKMWGLPRAPPPARGSAPAGQACPVHSGRLTDAGVGYQAAARDRWSAFLVTPATLVCWHPRTGGPLRDLMKATGSVVVGQTRAGGSRHESTLVGPGRVGES
jgi:hypothetical protein